MRRNNARPSFIFVCRTVRSGARISRLRAKKRRMAEMLTMRGGRGSSDGDTFENSPVRQVSVAAEPKLASATYLSRTRSRTGYQFQNTSAEQRHKQFNAWPVLFLVRPVFHSITAESVPGRILPPHSPDTTFRPTRFF